MSLLNNKKIKQSSEWLDMRKMLSEFNRSLTLIVGKDLLIANAISKIKQIFKVNNISFYIQQPDTDRFQVLGTTEKDNNLIRDTFFTSKNLLPNWLAVNETYLLVSQSPTIVDYLSEEEQNFIKEIGAEFIYPLIVMNRLSGFVFIGKKTDGSDFNDNELEVLTLLLDQAAFAIEHSTLYEEQSVRIKKMYRADRLAILGQLAAGAAHEIRNPLTSIRSTMQYIEKDIKDPQKLEMVQELMEEVDRINKIVQGLLSFSKPSELETSEIDVVKLLQQTMLLLGNMIQKEKIEIKYDIRADSTVIIADADQLKQVFLNILLNATEAIAGVERKKIIISLEAGLPIDFRSRYLIISFLDNGKGISSNNLENVFNPFYTTKKDGTGLGLAISYGIISKHKGEMEIESEINKGTKISIKLPQMLRQ